MFIWSILFLLVPIKISCKSFKKRNIRKHTTGGKGKVDTKERDVHAGRRRVVVVLEQKNHCLKWTSAVITLVVVINTNRAVTSHQCVCKEEALVLSQYFSPSAASILAFIHVNMRHFLKIKHQVLEVCRVMFYLTPVCMCKKKKLLAVFKITLSQQTLDFNL